MTTGNDTLSIHVILSAVQTPSHVDSVQRVGRGVRMSGGGGSSITAVASGDDDPGDIGKQVAELQSADAKKLVDYLKTRGLQ